MEDTEYLLEKYEQAFQELPAFEGTCNIGEMKTRENLERVFSCIDLTTLNTSDSSNSVQEFCDKVVAFHCEFPDMPLLAAVCTYPAFASVLKARLRGLDLGKAVVTGGFPSSQTFLDVKMMETSKALEMGANEIDIVISAGEFLEGNYEFVMEEISNIKSVTRDNCLKVILETGVLSSAEKIWDASIIAMEAGADFIKTSTGKTSPAATPDAFWIMAHAVKAFHAQTGKAVGLKPAGGISTSDDALVYYCLVKDVLGDDWLTPAKFRIGASRLANHLLEEVAELGGPETGPRF